MDFKEILIRFVTGGLFVAVIGLLSGSAYELAKYLNEKKFLRSMLIAIVICFIAVMALFILTIYIGSLLLKVKSTI